MRVDNQKNQALNHQQNPSSRRQPETRKALKMPEDKVEIKKAKIEKFKVGDNDPSRPLVSTKVLDSLSTGMINFNQKERDTIATILGQMAAEVRQKRS